MGAASGALPQPSNLGSRASRQEDPHFDARELGLVADEEPPN
jgi:hypothetical protein